MNRSRPKAKNPYWLLHLRLKLWREIEASYSKFHATGKSDWLSCDGICSAAWNITSSLQFDSDAEIRINSWLAEDLFQSARRQGKPLPGDMHWWPVRRVYAKNRADFIRDHIIKPLEHELEKNRAKARSRPKKAR